MGGRTAGIVLGKGLALALSGIIAHGDVIGVALIILGLWAIGGVISVACLWMAADWSLGKGDGFKPPTSDEKRAQKFVFPKYHFFTTWF